MILFGRMAATFNLLNHMPNEDDNLPSLEALDARIREVKHASEDAPSQVKVSEGKSFALRSGTEMMAGVGVGAFIGYQIDSWLDTRPWFLIVLIFLGFAGGVVNMYRAVAKEAPLLDKMKTLAEESSDSPRRKDENAGE